MPILTGAAALLALLLAVLLWLLAIGPRAYLEDGPAPAPDPYEGELRQFRREIHDWTRDN